MNVAAIVFRKREFRPLPISHRFRKQFKFPRGRVVAGDRFSPTITPTGFPSFVITPFASTFRTRETSRSHRLFVLPINIGGHFVSAILAHVFERLQSFFRGGFGQSLEPNFQKSIRSIRRPSVSVPDDKETRTTAEFPSNHRDQSPMKD
jgi:hypothetical protein